MRPGPISRLAISTMRARVSSLMVIWFCWLVRFIVSRHGANIRKPENHRREEALLRLRAVEAGRHGPLLQTEHCIVRAKRQVLRVCKSALLSTKGHQNS